MRRVLGIDQGGTKTHALVGDEAGHILGVGADAGACHSIDGMEAAMHGAKGAVEKALAMAGVDIGAVTAVAAGMTGVDWPEEAGLLTRALSETLGLDAGRIHVVNDCVIALRAGTSSPMGCVLCAGTGFNCAVRDGNGGEFVYGYYIDDADQGGAALARRVLRAVFDAHTRVGAPTTLTARCLEAAGCADVDALLRAKVEGRLTRAALHRLPIIADAEALAGDAVAQAVLARFGRDEAAYAAAAIRRMGLSDAPVEVVLSGSVFKCKSPALRRAVEETILEAAPRARVVGSLLEPAVGALLLALDDLGAAEPSIVQENLERDARRFGMIREGADATR